MKTTFRDLDKISREAANAFISATMHTSQLRLPFDADGEITIELKINGVEVDFVAIIESYASTLNERVACMAAAMATNKVWDGFNKLTDIIERAKEELESKTRELFPDAFPNED